MTDKNYSYYVYYPRDFANEYKIFTVAEDLADDFLELYPRAEPISLERARRMRVLARSCIDTQDFGAWLDADATADMIFDEFSQLQRGRF